MTELADDQPRWRQVRDILKQRIVSGQYKPGQRVPSERDLQQEFGVAAQTAHKALAGLRADGLIRTERGMGSFVARTDGPGNDETPPPGEA